MNREELRLKVVADFPFLADAAAIFRPCQVEWFRRVIAETVTEVVFLQRAIEEEDSRREHMCKVLLRRVEDALAVRAETAE